MLIYDFIREAEASGIRLRLTGDRGQNILGVSCDGRRTAAGDIFFCKGANFKREYLAQAVKNGALAAVMSEEEYARLSAPLGVPVLISESEADTLRSMAVCSALVYGYPLREMSVICVTGTKGKSSVCALIKSIMTEAGARCALLGDYLPSEAPRLTTPEAPDIHLAARRAVADGVTHLVCEVSSQAQKLYRTYGILPDIACFTNLGEDHIGPREHADMEEYYRCKASLFENAGLSVINLGDGYGRRLFSELQGKDKKGFSLIGKNGDIVCTKAEIGTYGCVLKVFDRGRGAFYLVTDAGVHNAENALCAAAACRAMGAGANAVTAGVLKCRVSGRGEIYESVDGRCAVTVDYAHNEMSFEAMLKNAKKRFAGAIVTVVFGCPGDKAQCRRRGLARVCARLADRVILCDDDGGDEGYESIKNEMKAHFAEAIAEGGGRLSPFRVSYIESREEAIRHAVALASESGERNAILMLGKGDENKNRARGCDRSCETDASLAKKALADYDSRHGIKEMLKNLNTENGCIAAVLEDDGECRTLFSGVSLLLRKGVKLFAVCRTDGAERIRRLAFAEGVAVSIRTAESLSAEAIEEVNGEMKIGALPFFVTDGSLTRALGRLCGAFLPKKAVYITKKTAMIDLKSFGNGKISLSALRIIGRGGIGGYFEQAEAAIGRGASELAVIHGRNAYALTAYLCGGRCDGLLISAG